MNPDDLDVLLHALLSFSLPTCDPASCPPCAQGLPLAKPGSLFAVPHK